MKGNWITIRQDYDNVTEVIYLGCLGLIRNTFYDHDGNATATTLVEIDAQSACLLVESYKGDVCEEV